MTLEIDKSKIKTFNNFKEPFDTLSTPVMLSCVVGKSMCCKSFMSLELIKSMKNIDKMGLVVIGADEKKSPVYSTLAEYFKDRIVFMPEYTDDIFDKFESLIEEPPFVDFEYNILIIDDLMGLLTPKLKKRVEKAITSYRHYGINIISQIQSIRSVSLPKVLRSNATIICVSSKASLDLKELSQLSQIPQLRLDAAISEANKHEYSFIVWCVTNDYYNIWSSKDGWI